MDIDRILEASSGLDHVYVAGASTAGTNLDRAVGGRIPASIPRDQAYYWSTQWQENEAEALDELMRGEGRTFDSAADAIKWLLSEDDLDA